mmetsp:Transcript_12103/g.52158  ORF Transcript_12103/g.52158 Transcript_12103/m.52158 type:complete len:84 (+) Transcript_12103:744-995(+)
MPASSPPPEPSGRRLGRTLAGAEMAIVSLEADARLTRDPRGEPEARAGPFLMLTAALNDECTACMRGLPDRGSREGDVRLRVA